MINSENYGTQDMCNGELQNINGGFAILGTLAAIAGIIYIAGRQDSNCDK